ncbi:siderophore-interacting protein [Pseudoduganella flava]|nr:siderophore-interacting protein [Pseudoduganella flava]QGZ38805.1 siderophore-interacting protein [Pseudoduganella flava]
MTTPPPPSAGLIGSALLKLFTRAARVVDIEDAGPAFRIVTLGGPALRNAAWTPGDKIQVQLPGWVRRTYTPMHWDAVYGLARILVYLHGDGPGARWARSLRKGDTCSIYGPRRSIVPDGAPVILFGDETSLGLAAALRSDAAPGDVHVLLEVSRDADVRPVLERLRLGDAHIAVREAGERHLAALQEHLTALLRTHDSADVVLSGKAGSIQHLSRALRQHGIGAARRHTKAYWAPGKQGMD